MELSYISGNENPQRFLIFQEVTEKKVHLEKMSYTSRNRSPQKTSYIFSKESLFYILGNGNHEKTPYISGKETFLCCRKLFIFEKVTF